MESSEQSNNLTTPCNEAIKEGDLEKVKNLLEKIEQSEIPEDKVSNLLITAVKHVENLMSVEVVKSLLKCSKIDIDHINTDYFYRTNALNVLLSDLSLHNENVLQKQLKIAELLIEKGININHKSFCGTPLKQIIQLLFPKDSSSLYHDHCKTLLLALVNDNKIDLTKETNDIIPLIDLIKIEEFSERKEIIERLCKRYKEEGVSLNEKDDKGRTALSYAVRKAVPTRNTVGGFYTVEQLNSVLVKVLLENGAKITSLTEVEKLGVLNHLTQSYQEYKKGVLVKVVDIQFLILAAKYDYLGFVKSYLGSENLESEDFNTLDTEGNT